ncbi:MAG: aquaporin Z [candidate division WOR-3 bacterium]
MSQKAWKRWLAELIGTFCLVFIGCGSAVIAGSHIGFAGISLAFGLAVLAMVYAIGPISGCHINPAISVAMLVAGKQKFTETIAYIIAQCIGAILGAIVLFAIASTLPDYSLSVNGLGQNGFGAHSPGGYSLVAALDAEVILTTLFVLVVLGATSEKAPAGFAGVAIGLALTFIHLVGIPITGTSVNPARSLGPALIVGGPALQQVWLFILAPLVGGVLAALIWRLLSE